MSTSILKPIESRVILPLTRWHAARLQPWREPHGDDRDTGDDRSRNASRAADRAPVVGVRQLRDAVQGLPPGGRPARPVREDRRRRAGPPLHRRRPDGRAAHPVGQGRRLRATSPSTPRELGVALGHDQLQHVPGQRLHARRRPPPRRPVRRKAWTTCSSASTSWTRPGRATSSCGSPTAPTTRARTTSAPARTASRRRCAIVYDRLGDGPADRARVQAVRAVVLHDRRAGLGDVARALPRAGPEGEGRGRHRAPRPGHQHRVHRRVAAAGWASSAGSTSTPASTPTTT